MKYQKLDKTFLTKWLEILDRLDRMTSRHYEQGICQKDVFIRRTANKWATGITVAMIQRVATGAFTSEGKGYNDQREIMIPIKRYLSINRISFNYGHSDGINVFITDAVSSHNVFNELDIKLHDLFDLEFYYITQDQFMGLATLFTDDRPMKYFEIKCWDKETHEDRLKIFEGQDQSEAWEKGQKKDDIVLGNVIREVSVSEVIELIS